METNDLNTIKQMIESCMQDIEYWQRKHRSLTGRDYVQPFYLTEVRNQATLEPNQKPDRSIGNLVMGEPERLKT